ncbi:MAG: hypothetical protein QGG48_02555 [Desulfatiglandales bacterium]|jgi:long-chain acyl-CoA synthetase|nr:hypothetical protein [Desulfatiglandales bacterium]
MLLLSEVRLVDNFDRPLPSGLVGESTIKGPMVFKGYWNFSEETALQFQGGLASHRGPGPI